MRRKMRRIQGEQSEAKKEKEEREGRGEREGREYEKERLRPREGRVADGSEQSTLFVPRNQNSVRKFCSTVRVRPLLADSSAPCANWSCRVGRAVGSVRGDSCRERRVMLLNDGPTSGPVHYRISLAC